MQSRSPDEEIKVATLKSPRRRACAWLSPANVLLAFLVCVYFGTGCAFYMTVEGWNGYEAMYFLMVTASTVGYGDMNPTSGVQGTSASLTGSRIFTVVYIFFMFLFYQPLLQGENAPVVFGAEHIDDGVEVEAHG